ncbi:hypothetical protein [Neobacillus niacini]|uniref:hypothetical protein n=1 Tax=Neobacillus niacini TaxID=86668 RepID=UPI003B58AEB6
MVPVTARGQIGHFVHERFKQFGIQHGLIVKRNNRDSLDFQDFEGTRLVLVADNGEEGVSAGVTWVGSDGPVENAIIGLGPVTLTVADPDKTVHVLTEVRGFRKVGTYPSTLGEKLALPPFLEPRRADIEAKLRPLGLESK